MLHISKSIYRKCKSFINKLRTCEISGTLFRRPFRLSHRLNRPSVRQLLMRINLYVGAATALPYVTHTRRSAKHLPRAGSPATTPRWFHDIYNPHRPLTRKTRQSISQSVKHPAEQRPVKEHIKQLIRYENHQPERSLGEFIKADLAIFDARLSVFSIHDEKQIFKEFQLCGL